MMRVSILLRIVSGIHEDSWKHAVNNTVSTFHDNAVLHGLDEFIVEKKLPDRMKQLPSTVSHQRITLLDTTFL